ncbi:hypothetical protein AB870_23120 [Pandoraea faecigallinarum]|uniref:Inclusion body protein n=1 Tax=Pandoraea faecigallinarum TaxID=656179 RepID=A0A0H3WVY3_9BURK|nr:hypothetical protein [Pandoraea faecigallinarum]AKM32369.1 hypothetical protein AB870_23120 [Pandoraea faecigallinarum]
MSDAPTRGGPRDESTAVTDALLVIDTVTLLDSPADSSHSPDSSRSCVHADRTSHVGGDACYCLAPGAQALRGVRASTWTIDVPVGERLRLRWTPLAMRGEHAVLLELSLTDEAVLGDLRLHVEDHAVRYAPQPGKPQEAVAREAPDAYWQADVVASGTADLGIDAIVTDRDATVLARFGWTLRIVVP